MENNTMTEIPKNRGRLLCGLLALVYFTSYLTRLNFTAVMAELTADGVGVLTKTEAGAVGTALFITYGAGQIVSGFLSDRFRPERVIATGFLLTIVCNVLMPFAGGAVPMTCIWAVNGFAQALFWPPIVRLMATYYDEAGYAKCNWVVSVSCHLATVFVYIAVAGCVTFLDWKSVFFGAGAFALLSLAIFTVGFAVFRKGGGSAPRKLPGSDPATVSPQTPALTEPGTPAAGAPEMKISGATPPIAERPVTEAPTAEASAVGTPGAKAQEMTSALQSPSAPRKTSVFRLFLCTGTVFILFAIIMQGFLKDGVQSWLPVFFTETFSLSSAGAILSNTVLPVFNIVIVSVATVLYQKVFRHEIKEALTFFAVVVVCSLLLAVFMGKSALMCLVLAALITGCAHGVNLMFISFVPRRFAGYGKVAFVSGLLNACTYIGSATSSFGVALVAEKMGWRAALLSWGVVALVGILLCAFAYRRWSQFIKQPSNAPERHHT